MTNEEITAIFEKFTQKAGSVTKLQLAEALGEALTVTSSVVVPEAVAKRPAVVRYEAIPSTEAIFAFAMTYVGSSPSMRGIHDRLVSGRQTGMSVSEMKVATSFYGQYQRALEMQSAIAAPQAMPVPTAQVTGRLASALRRLRLAV